MKKAKGDVYWYIPKRKTPVAYSTIATKLLIDVLSHDDLNRTIQDVYNLINYDIEAKEILKIYIDKGFGNEVASKGFG